VTPLASAMRTSRVGAFNGRPPCLAGSLVVAFSFPGWQEEHGIRPVSGSHGTKADVKCGGLPAKEYSRSCVLILPLERMPWVQRSSVRRSRSILIDQGSCRRLLTGCGKYFVFVFTSKRSLVRSGDDSRLHRLRTCSALAEAAR
jgi:hypothetical protein